MERNIECTMVAAEELKERYLSRLYLADELFDGRPFSLAPTTMSANYRPVAGIYDGVMVALDELWANKNSFVTRKAEIQAAYDRLVTQHISSGLLTGSANTAADIRNRIGIFRKFFEEFI